MPIKCLEITFFASKTSAFFSIQGTVIFILSRNSVKQFLMKYRHLLLNNDAKNTHLSLDHIKTGTGNEDSAAEHTKREINPVHNKKEDEAAILDHQVKST